MLSAATLTDAIDLCTGQVRFPVVLAARSGRNGIDLLLEAVHTGASLWSATNWNRVAPTGVLGLGWSLAIDRIEAVDGQSALPADCSYLLRTAAAQSRLVRIGTNSDGSFSFAAENYLFWQISYDPVAERWKVIDEHGTVHLFGGAAGRGAVDWAVAWGGWKGPSGSVSGQRRLAVSWLLASTTNRFGDQVSYRYNQVPMQVGSSDGESFTQASYLAEMIGADNSRIVLSYAAKDPAEYADPHPYPAPPNAWQDPLRTQYLSAVDLYAASGVRLERVTFGYASPMLGSAALSKRLLTSMARIDSNDVAIEPPVKFSYWGQSSADGVSAQTVFNSSNGALYGALKAATLPAGGTVSYAYGATIPAYSGRSLGMTVPAGGTLPRFLFDDDTTLALWLDGSNMVHLHAYVYAGRWLMTELATVQLASAAVYADVQMALGEGCAALFAAGQVVAVARDVSNPGAWLSASSYTPALTSGEAATLVAGRGFAALLGLTGGALYRYRFAAGAWVADAALNLVGSSFAVAAGGAMLVALAAQSGGGDTSVSLVMRGTDGTWDVAQASLDLGGLTGTLQVLVGGGFAVARAVSAVAGSQSAQYGALWWTPDLSTVSGQAWITLNVAANATPPLPNIAGSTVAIGQQLYRFGGVSWSSFDAATVNSPDAGSLLSSALAPDWFARLFTGTSGGTTRYAAMLVYDPGSATWSTPSTLSIEGSTPFLALPPRTTTGAPESVLLGTSLWQRQPTVGGADGWTSSMQLPAGLNDADVASAQLLGDRYLLLQTATGTSAVATLIYLLGNGGVLNANAPITLSGSQFVAPDQPTSALVGERAFIAYTGTWGSGAVPVLYRPVVGDVQGTQTAYAVASVVADNGTSGIAGVNGAFTTQYLPAAAGATIDIGGYLPRFNQQVVVPGADQTTSGAVTWGIYNGLAATENPAVPYPNPAVSNPGANSLMVAGLSYSQTINDGSAAIVGVTTSYLAVTTLPLGQWGIAGYARLVRRDSELDGVTRTDQTSYATETGLPTQVSCNVYNAAGTLDSFAKLFTYWWQIYDSGRATNMLTPIVQVETQSIPAGSTASTTGVSIQTWRDWGNGAGRWAPDRSFAATATPSNPSSFNAWNPADPAPASGYLMTTRVLQRAASGLATETVEAFNFLNRYATLIYDSSGFYLVAAGRNLPSQSGMLSWFGCESYEASGGWTSSDPGRSILDYITTADSHTGAQCLALPAASGSSGPLLRIQPTDQTRFYLFSCWARAANGFDPAAGTAQWTVQTYDPVSGANVGTPITLALTPSTGTPTAVGGWSYFQVTIDLPALLAASGKTALGLSLAATNANTAQPCYVDELRFMPLDCVFSATVYDPKRGWPVARIDSNGQSNQLRYRADGTAWLGLGPNDRVDWVKATGYSRTISATDSFSPTFPNSELTLTSSVDSRYYDFREGNSADWTFSDTNWSIAAGQLVHAGAATGPVGATATLNVSAYTDFAASIDVASAQPTAAGSVSLGNGDIYLQWAQTGSGGTWQLVQIVSGVATVREVNAVVPWGRRWTFAAVEGFVLCYADAAQIFAYPYQLPSQQSGKVWIAATGNAAFDDLVVLNTPQIALSAIDGLGSPLQDLNYMGVETASGLYPNLATARAGGVLLDAQGRPAIRRLDMDVPLQIAAPSVDDDTADQLIAAGPTTYLYSPTGQSLSLTNFEAGQGGYCYQQTSYEGSPLGRPTAVLLPRPNDTADPAANYTISLSYTGTAALGGAPVAANGKYLVETAGRVQSVTGNAPTSVASAVTRDALGRVLMAQQGQSVAGALQQVRQIEYLYDASGRPATIRQPNYFAPGSNASAWTETRTYDYLNRLTQRTSPDSGTIQYMYDSASRLRFILDAAGAAASPPCILYVKYDMLDRAVESGYISDPARAWNSSLQGLADTAAFPIIVANPQSGTNQASGAWRKRFAYDFAGTANADGADFTRFLVGRLNQASVNPKDDGTSPDLETYLYDAFGNPVAKTVTMPGISSANGWTTSYSYNARDAVASIAYPALDGNPPTVSYSYDRLGRLAGIGTADAGGIVDPSNPPGDPVIRYAFYQYDNFGRLAAVQYNNVATVGGGAPVPRSFSYDPAQRLIGIADPYFVEQLQYAGSGIAGVTYCNGAIASASSTYLPSANWPKPPPGFTEQFAYDVHGRVSGVLNSLGNPFALSFPAAGYDLNGNIVGLVRGAMQASYAYLGSGANVTNQVATVTQAVTGDASVNFTQLQVGATSAGGWSWGANNNGPSASGIIASSPPGGQALVLMGGSLGHYEVLQLATYLAPNATCTLSWHAATGTGYGQAIGAAVWCVVLYAASGPSVALPQLVLSASAGFSPGSVVLNLPQLIQQNGGGLEIVAASIELRNCGRNADGSPGPQVYLADVGLSGSVTGQPYVYDADGHVTAAPDRNLQLAYYPDSGLTRQVNLDSTGTNTLSFAYGADDLRSCATLAGTNSLQTVTLRGLDGAPLATQTTDGTVVATHYHINGNSGVIARISGQDLQFLLVDHLGSPRVTVDAASGQPLQAVDYLPFGGALRRSGPPAGTSGFTGQRRDAATGLYDYNARLYDPALGRFYAADAQNQHASPYAYVGNDPVNSIDPDGNRAVWAQTILTGVSYGINYGPAALSLYALYDNWQSALIGTGVGLAVESAVTLVAYRPLFGRATTNWLGYLNRGMGLFGLTRYTIYVGKAGARGVTSALSSSANSVAQSLYFEGQLPGGLEVTYSTISGFATGAAVSGVQTFAEMHLGPPARYADGKPVYRSERAGNTYMTPAGPVTYSWLGFPDFLPYSDAVIFAPPGYSTGNMKVDEAYFTSVTGLPLHNGFTLQHDPYYGVLMRVRSDAHNLRNGGVPHAGSRAIRKHGGNAMADIAVLVMSRALEDCYFKSLDWRYIYGVAGLLNRPLVQGNATSLHDET